MVAILVQSIASGTAENGIEISLSSNQLNTPTESKTTEAALWQSQMKLEHMKELRQKVFSTNLPPTMKEAVAEVSPKQVNLWKKEAAIRREKEGLQREVEEFRKKKLAHLAIMCKDAVQQKRFAEF